MTPINLDKKSRTKYTYRNLYLSDLGYSSYKEYLKSDDWKKIRDRKLKKWPECILCGKKAEVVHHVKYDPAALLGLRAHVLASLCHRCHESIEIQDGAKCSLEAANRKLFIEARKNSVGKAWCQRYYNGLHDEKKLGLKDRYGKVANKTLQEAKPWRNE